MHYPFVLLGHGGYQILEGEDRRRWTLLLSVQAHVSDTGDECEKNKAMNVCGEILDDLLARATSTEMKTQEPWARGFELAGAVATPVENADNALYGWVIEFHVVLPFCKDFDAERWQDGRIINDW